MALVQDIDENSRVLDPTLSGTLLADMGAYERSDWTMKVFGEPNAGSILKLRVDGIAGVSAYLIGQLDGSFPSSFGYVTAGSATLSVIGNLPVGQVLRLRVPHELALIGTEIGIQTQTLATATPPRGGMTNLYRAILGGPQEEPQLQIAR